MVRKTKPRRAGGSLAATTPKEMLDRLRLGEGDAIHVRETPEGILLTPYDPEFADGLAAFEHVSRKFRNALREPRWLSRALLDAVHDALVSLHGGLPGVASEHLVESALGRARSACACAGADLAACAAAYAFGLAKHHGYRDGNGRTAFAAAATFLRLNGMELEAGEGEVVEVIVLLATDRVSEAQLADWVRERVARG